MSKLFALRLHLQMKEQLFIRMVIPRHN